MREPKFSESQLQQAANSAFVQRVANAGYSPPFVHVPSLCAEFELGWDSAVYLPWLAYPPDPSNEGCNFFIQYKLSLELSTPGAKEWKHWGAEYYRFKIPHAARTHSGGSTQDFHQWRRLKALANLGLPTYYATNAFLEKSTLINYYSAGNLLEHIPLLDVRQVRNQHKHVTFKPGFPNFRLHSEVVEQPILTFSTGLDALRQEVQHSLSDSTRIAVKALREIAENDSQFIRELTQFEEVAADFRLPEMVIVERLNLMKIVHRHLGAYLLWCPKDG